MRNRILLIFSLLTAFMVTGTVMAAPRSEMAEEHGMQKQQISGMVESVQGQRATIRTEHGDRVQVYLGPASYWHKHGYRLIPGREVTVAGWGGENDEGQFIAGSITGPDFYFELGNNHGFRPPEHRDGFRGGPPPMRGIYNADNFGPPHHFWRGPMGPMWRHHRHPFFCGPRGRMAWGHGRPNQGYMRDGHRGWGGRYDGRWEDHRGGGHNDGRRHGSHQAEGHQRDRRGDDRQN